MTVDVLRALSQLSGSKWQPIDEDATIEAVEALKLTGVTIVNGKVTKLALHWWSDIVGE